MKEITVIAKNKPGEVAHLADILAERGINIIDIDAETSDAFGVIHLVVDRYDEALKALRDAEFKAFSEEALIVRLDDKPGALATVARRLAPAQINLRSMHIVRRESGSVLVSLVTSDNARAAELVQDVLVSRI
jgi:hypothetical protein